MKCKTKSAPNITKFVILFLLLPLCGCSGNSLNWLTGEPSEEILSAKRAVKVPVEGGESVWPNLADVPEERPSFSSPAVRREQETDLISDKLQTEAKKIRIQNIYVPLPPAQEVVPETNIQDNVPQKVYKPFSALLP
ncbi:MAG: hypothetical protein AB7S81_01230 [Bdellovibrionales bacterium]